MTAQCSTSGPYLLIAGAITIGLLSLLLYPMKQSRLQNNSNETSTSDSSKNSMTLVNIIVAFVWIIIVIPSIIGAVITLYEVPCYHTRWREKQCVITSINKEPCLTVLLQSGFYYTYSMRPKACNSPDSIRCGYDDSNGRTDCETSGDYQVGDERECWVWYEDNNGLYVY